MKQVVELSPATLALVKGMEKRMEARLTATTRRFEDLLAESLATLDKHAAAMIRLAEAMEDDELTERPLGSPEH